MELLIGSWLLCGLIAAAIGSSKGEGCLAFFVGALFGPLGILFALLSSGNRVACAYCRSKIDRRALVCPQCRHAGPAAPATTVQGGPQGT